MKKSAINNLKELNDNTQLSSKAKKKNQFYLKMLIFMGFAANSEIASFPKLHFFPKF